MATRFTKISAPRRSFIHFHTKSYANWAPDKSVGFVYGWRGSDPGTPKQAIVFKLFFVAGMAIAFSEGNPALESAMYLGPMILFSIFASLFYIPGFLDTPMGVLTPRQLLSQLLFCVFALIALASLARSIERDPIWPWRPEFQHLINTLLGRTQ